MAIHQTKKQSDLEKRLKLLRQQVYGREPVVSNKQYVVGKETTPRNTHTTNYQQHTTDVTYLYQDLLKIGIFTSVAIGTQIILFILSKNHFLNLNFF